MRLALLVTGTVAMLAAIRLDPWGRRWEAAALYLFGAAGAVFALVAE